MDIEIPEDLSGLSVSELQALLDQINEGGLNSADAANKAEAGSAERKEHLATVAALQEAKVKVEAALETANAEAANEDAAIAEATKAFGGSDEEDGDEEEADEEETPTETETPAEETPAEDEAATEVEEPEAIAASGAMKVRVPAGRSKKRKVAPAEKAGSGSDAYSGRLSLGEEPIVSIRQLTELFKRAHMGADRNGDGRGMVATFNRFRDQDPKNMVEGPDGFRNADIMARAQADPGLIMAAGGFCGPGEVITEIQTCGRTDRPVGARIPTINARGEYVFSRPVGLADVAAGIQYYTEADDNAIDPEDEATWKDCYHLTCGTTVTALPIAVWACFQYGTFQQWSRPEQIQAALNLFDVALARRSEALALQRIHDLSNQFLYTPADGTTIQNALIDLVGRLLDLAEYQGRVDVTNGYELWVPGALIRRVITDAAQKAWVGPTLTQSQIVNQLEELYNVQVVVTPDVRANALAPVEALAAAPAPAGAAQVPCPHTQLEVLLLDPNDFRHGVDDVDVVVQTDIATARKNDKSTVLETIETTEKFGCKASFSVLIDEIHTYGSQPDLVAADDTYCPGPLPLEYAGETPVGFPGGAIS